LLGFRKILAFHSVGVKLVRARGENCVLREGEKLTFRGKQSDDSSLHTCTNIHTYMQTLAHLMHNVYMQIYMHIFIHTYMRTTSM